MIIPAPVYMPMYFTGNSSIDTRLYITGLKEYTDIKISLNMDGM